jgi:hypothetical protein
MNEHQFNSLADILLVIGANGLIFFLQDVATPLLTFTTALCSLYYIGRKIKKDFYNNKE